MSPPASGRHSARRSAYTAPETQMMLCSCSCALRSSTSKRQKPSITPSPLSGCTMSPDTAPSDASAARRPTSVGTVPRAKVWAESANTSTSASPAARTPALSAAALPPGASPATTRTDGGSTARYCAGLQAAVASTVTTTSR
jgi:hypothetical protein